jgi:CheY-like chemotaxis protein
MHFGHGTKVATQGNMSTQELLSTTLPLPTRTARSRPQRILVADDDPDIRELLSRVLTIGGYEVSEVGGGAELLDYLGSSLLSPNRVRPPDLLIADVGMPEFGGLEVLAGLRRDTWSLPVLVVTARADDHTSELAYRFGATAFLRKPFRMDVLRAVVHSILGDVS